MGKRVLLADDSATIQRAFTMVFASSEVEPAGARSFDEAVASARKNRPDLVIADVNLGTRTGYDLCAAFKGDASLRSIPVYILSSNHAPFDDARGRQVGADGNFVKPFDSQALIDKVLDALARPAAAPAPVPVAAPAAAPAPGPSTFTVGARSSSASNPVARPAPLAAPPRAPAPGPVAVAPAPGLEIEIEDDYGEFTIERSGSAPRPVAAPAPAPASSGSGLRPSLIPGAPPPAPGRPLISTPVSSRTSSSSLAVPSAVRAPIAPVTPVPMPPPPVARPVAANTPPMGRTIMGMPAILPQMMAGQTARTAPPFSPFSAPAPTAPPVAAPVAPIPTAPTTPVSIPTAPVSMPMPMPMPAAVASRIDEKIAQIAARGPEYEALAKLSREIIEQIVWEVVPELAELIIRQEIDRLAKGAK